MLEPDTFESAFAAMILSASVLISAGEVPHISDTASGVYGSSRSFSSE